MWVIRLKIESLLAIIGSGGIIALFTTIITKLGTDKGYEVKHIVDERKLWRQEIRTEIERVGRERTVENLKQLKTFLTLRLNPKDSADNSILKDIDLLLNNNSDFYWNILLKKISKLLKHDWERSKREVRTANIIIQIIFIAIYTKLILSIDSFKNLLYDWNLNLETIERFSLAICIYFSGILFLHLTLKHLIKYIFSFRLRSKN